MLKLLKKTGNSLLTSDAFEGLDQSDGIMINGIIIFLTIFFGAIYVILAIATTHNFLCYI